MDDRNDHCTSRPSTPPLVHSPSTARSSFSSRERDSGRPPLMGDRSPTWGKRHASLDSPRERPTIVAPGTFEPSPPTPALLLNGPPPPDPPHIHTPPSSPSARPYAYPFLPSHEPRGADRPSVTVDTRPDKYLLVCRMPHFSHSSITVATRRGRLLVIAADRWDTEWDPTPFSLDASSSSRPSPAHFERRITFGWDADMARIRAEFDGQVLHVSVPRRHISHTMGLPRTTHRASAPASNTSGPMRYNPLEISTVPADLELTRTHSAQSESAPHRRDVAWPLG
ncbi:heat shock protein HSP20 family protein [Ceratobasidium sp. AG-Ba]|nr:heat shock protein HSP20 family protein [Ceratobasidium sp. AG-Ba]